MKTIFAILVTALLLTGCFNTTIKIKEYPLPDKELLIKPPKLLLLPDNSDLSDVSKTITKNYTSYNLIATRLELLQTWILKVYEESLNVNDTTTDTEETIR